MPQEGGISVPQPDTNPCLLLGKRRSPDPWTAREEPGTEFVLLGLRGSQPPVLLGAQETLSLSVSAVPAGTDAPTVPRMPSLHPCLYFLSAGTSVGGGEKSMGKSSIIAFELGTSGALGRGWAGYICISLAGLRPGPLGCPGTPLFRFGPLLWACGGFWAGGGAGVPPRSPYSCWGGAGRS